MKKTHLMVAVLSVFLMQLQARSQSTELPKFEVAGEFTTLQREAYVQGRTEAGFGARFTYNLNRAISLETAGYFFPQQCGECTVSGNVIEVLGGVKIGKRFEHWGIFAKARPGVASFSRGKFSVVPDPSNPTFPFDFIAHRRNAFATDVGAVVEFYPSKRIVTRFDLGDTIIHLNSQQVQAFSFDSTTGTFTPIPFTQPSRNMHDIQFMASVGFRF